MIIFESVVFQLNREGIMPFDIGLFKNILGSIRSTRILQRSKCTTDSKCINLMPFASTAPIRGTLSGQRTCVRAPPASFEKFAAHFSNPAFGGTEPAEALPLVLVKIAVNLTMLSFH